MLPAGTTSDARRLLVTRSFRGFADGLVSVLLARWLEGLGFNAFQIGAIVTSTLLGSAALTLAIGLAGHRVRRRFLLLCAATLMVATGFAFAGVTSFWPLLVIAFVGTINPSAGDVTLFLPTEQAVLAEVVPGRDRTLMFAWYNLCGSFAGAAGALAARFPQDAARLAGVSLQLAMRAAFVVYALFGVASLLAYRGLSSAAELDPSSDPGVLRKSRRVVLQLSALFSLDSFGGGFVVQSLLALWLYVRFGISVREAATFFFVTGLLGAVSQFVASSLTKRIGHVRTMVFTHLPANLLLIAAGLVPGARAAVVCLVVRSLVTSMDVPARQAYVMSVVPREERAAASSVTNVPRSLAAALSPLIAGAMLSRSTFGWPLLCAGVLKATYDIVLFIAFSRLRAPDA